MTRFTFIDNIDFANIRLPLIQLSVAPKNGDLIVLHLLSSLYTNCDSPKSCMSWARLLLDKPAVDIFFPILQILYENPKMKQSRFLSVGFFVLNFKLTKFKGYISYLYLVTEHTFIQKISCPIAEFLWKFCVCKNRNVNHTFFSWLEADLQI